MKVDRMSRECVPLLPGLQRLLSGNRRMGRDVTTSSRKMKVQCAKRTAPEVEATSAQSTVKLCRGCKRYD